MKSWVPFVVALIITIVLNAFPAFMAFVVGDSGWAQVGWVVYFYSIPFSLVLLFVGALISLIMHRRRRSQSTD